MAKQLELDVLRVDYVGCRIFVMEQFEALSRERDRDTWLAWTRRVIRTFSASSSLKFQCNRPSIRGNRQSLLHSFRSYPQLLSVLLVLWRV